MAALFEVAVGVITDPTIRILITQRAQSADHGAMLWEFPGGKLELTETPEQALVREMKEELNISVSNFNYLGQIHHNYETHEVILNIFHVQRFEGVPTKMVSQIDLKWVEFAALKDFVFPEANQQIIDLIEDKIFYNHKC